MGVAVSTVVVVGQGYVGLPLSLGAVGAGHKVFGLEANSSIADALARGESHIDDIPDSALEGALAAGYVPTTDPSVINSADVVVVCVPTPLSPDGGPDLTAVESSASMIGKHLSPDTLVILESTTYPGTTEEIFAPLLTADSGLEAGVDINVAFSPERIDPGNEKYGIANTPKVVGGLTEGCTSRAADFYESFIHTVVRAKGAKEAELAKLLENTFRHVNIALVNEMLRFSQDLEIDLWNAIDCAATKPFGFMAFRPGPGVGGHCIPIDPTYLSHRVKARLGYSFRMVELAQEINTAAPQYVAERAADLLNNQKKSVNGSRILLLGVTYKPNISDTRESPADPLAVRLANSGADLSFYDPHVPTWAPHGLGQSLTCESDPVMAAKNADLVILLQPHREIDLESIATSGAVLLDTRAALAESASVHRL